MSVQTKIAAKPYTLHRYTVDIKINTDFPFRAHPRIMHSPAIFFGLQSKPRNYVIITLRLGFLQHDVRRQNEMISISVAT